MISGSLKDSWKELRDLYAAVVAQRDVLMTITAYVIGEHAVSSCKVKTPAIINLLELAG
jgi:hypothetical protein